MSTLAEGPRALCGETPLMPNDRRRALGQYFTPPTVIDFALDALAWLDEDGGDARARRLIDPACGDGGFLRRALERGLVAPANAFGIDADETLRATWNDALAPGPDGPWLGVGDGLLAEAVCGRPVHEEAFDWVVGNPPYAGEGLKHADAEVFARIAERYELCRLRYRSLLPGPEQLRRFPVEVLFAERFVRLCRPGGLIAVILPEGIFANERWRFVREWLLARVTLHAVVALPRTAFRPGRVTARTCLALARKGAPPPGHEVLLAEVERIGRKSGEANDLPAVLEAWRAGAEIAGPAAPWRLGA